MLRRCIRFRCPVNPTNRNSSATRASSTGADAATSATTYASGFDPSKVIPTAEHLAGRGHVQWREYWDLKTSRPYYHNTVTQKTFWERPENFPTKYPEFWELHDRAAASGVEIKPSAPLGTFSSGSMFKFIEPIKKHGLGGAVLYAIVHFGSWAIIFALLLGGVDVAAIGRWFGLDVSSTGSFMALWAVAIAINKIFAPAHLMISLALAPKYGPKISKAINRFRPSSSSS
eukprot:PhM_4_TR11801/c0_g1_i1/m.45298